MSRYLDARQHVKDIKRGECRRDTAAGTVFSGHMANNHMTVIR